jgi:hypothetical protein
MSVVMLSSSRRSEKWAFTRASRFPEMKQATDAFAKTDGSTFNKTLPRPTSFGSSETRFGYLNASRQQRMLATSYKDSRNKLGVLEVSLDKEKPLEKSLKYSFGTSRNRMQSVDVHQAISIQQKLYSGPGSPEKSKVTDVNIFKTKQPRFSIGLKINKFSQELEKQKELPGPGSYNNQKEKFDDKFLDSRKRNSISNRFSRAANRFELDLTKRAPPPNNYYPRNSLNENTNSRYRSRAKCVFSRDRQSGGTDSLFNMKRVKGMPGPGSYELVSDFG